MSGAMHDWSVKTLAVDWPSARATITLLSPGQTNRAVEIYDFQLLRIPRQNEWGPSNSINLVQDLRTLDSGAQQLTIEMQSGDVIEIIAQKISVVEV